VRVKESKSESDRERGRERMGKREGEPKWNFIIKHITARATNSR
jgi:hypothetical protein